MQSLPILVRVKAHPPAKSAGRVGQPNSRIIERVGQPPELNSPSPNTATPSSPMPPRGIWGQTGRSPAFFRVSRVKKPGYVPSVPQSPNRPNTGLESIVCPPIVPIPGSNRTPTSPLKPTPGLNGPPTHLYDRRIWRTFGAGRPALRCSGSCNGRAVTE